MGKEVHASKMKKGKSVPKSIKSTAKDEVASINIKIEGKVEPLEWKELSFTPKIDYAHMGIKGIYIDEPAQQAPAPEYSTSYVHQWGGGSKNLEMKSHDRRRLYNTIKKIMYVDDEVPDKVKVLEVFTSDNNGVIIVDVNLNVYHVYDKDSRLGLFMQKLKCNKCNEQATFAEGLVLCEQCNEVIDNANRIPIDEPPQAVIGTINAVTLDSSSIYSKINSGEATVTWDSIE